MYITRHESRDSEFKKLSDFQFKSITILLINTQPQLVKFVRMCVCVCGGWGVFAGWHKIWRAPLPPSPRLKSTSFCCFLPNIVVVFWLFRASSVPWIFCFYNENDKYSILCYYSEYYENMVKNKCTIHFHGHILLKTNVEVSLLFSQNGWFFEI